MKNRPALISVIILAFLTTVIIYRLAFAKSYSNFQAKVTVTSQAPDIKQTGLRIYKPEKCYNGYTLFAHRKLYYKPRMNYLLPIYLIDMNGEIVYQWMVEHDSILAHLKPNGNLVYISGYSISEIDPQGNIVWKYVAQVDHAFQISEEGNFIINRNELSKTNCDRMSQSKDCVLNPRIEIISPDKKVLWQWKGEEHKNEVERLSGRPTIIDNRRWLDINSCEVLKDNPLAKEDKRFRKGNILACIVGIDLIAVIDYKTKHIVFAWGSDILRKPHASSMLSNGNILLFDNGCGINWSRVIEFNPLTGEIVWEYHGEPKEGFYSSTMSNAQRLPNGNTLICEAEKNRIFEITPEGEIVWDFISTFNKIAGTELIYQAQRYSPEYVEPLLKQLNNQRRHNDGNK